MSWYAKATSEIRGLAPYARRENVLQNVDIFGQVSNLLRAFPARSKKKKAGAPQGSPLRVPMRLFRFPDS